MKKPIVLLILMSLFFMDMYSEPNKRDSIYKDLCLFLVSRNIITEKYMLEFKDNFPSLIYIQDILEKNNNVTKPDLLKEIGIYRFDYIGRMDGASYILIKNKNSYKAFRETDISLIINEIIAIKTENTKLMPDDLFEKYLKEITKYNSKNLILTFKTGSIFYYIEKRR